MSAVDAAITEIDQKLAEYAPQHEGLRDFAALNLHEPTKPIVAESIAAYDQRKALLDAARTALAALRTDGHPTLNVREIPQSAFDDLFQNAGTIQAALSRFAPERAVSFGLTVGDPESKGPVAPEPGG